MKSYVNMFFEKNRKYVEIESGIGIHQLSRDTFEVKINDKIAIIEAEYIGGKYTRDIYGDILHSWNPPHNNENFSDEDRSEVLRALKLFFDKTGETYYP